MQKLVRFMQRDHLRKVLPQILKDVQSQLELRAPSSPGAVPGTIDPFDAIYRIVYQLTIRTLGPTEFAEDGKLADDTLELFQIIVDSSSPWKVVFPWLPTPRHLKRTYAGAKLYGMVRQLIQDRKASERKLPDAVQHLIDDGAGELNILKVCTSADLSCYGNTNGRSSSSSWVCYMLASSTPESALLGY